jgi:hypothetical protein
MFRWIKRLFLSKAMWVARQHPTKQQLKMIEKYGSKIKEVYIVDPSLHCSKFPYEVWSKKFALKVYNSNIKAIFSSDEIPLRRDVLVFTTPRIHPYAYTADKSIPVYGYDNQSKDFRIVSVVTVC